MGGPVIEQLQRDGLKVKPFMTTNASKSDAIEALALAFERGEIRILNDPTLIGELQASSRSLSRAPSCATMLPRAVMTTTVMALAIAQQSLAGHARRNADADFLQVCDAG